VFEPGPAATRSDGPGARSAADGGSALYRASGAAAAAPPLRAPASPALRASSRRAPSRRPPCRASRPGSGSGRPVDVPATVGPGADGSGSGRRHGAI